MRLTTKPFHSSFSTEQHDVVTVISTNESLHPSFFHVVVGATPFSQIDEIIALGETGVFFCDDTVQQQRE